MKFDFPKTVSTIIAIACLILFLLLLANGRNPVSEETQALTPGTERFLVALLMGLGVALIRLRRRR